MAEGGRCYACFRPREACFCAAIPRIDNRTEVVVLQHRREHFHRFNTARIVCQALQRSTLLTDHTPNLAHRLELKPRAGLLYPGPSATLISDLAPHQRPEQLIVVDGTWHHTKTLVRDIPALQALPRYQLAPSEPSRYRIRREPDTQSLSTVEAAVAALQVLEPTTPGLDLLLNAFDRMVESQLAHPGSSQGARYKQRSRPAADVVPLALQQDLSRIVVVYGEATPGVRGQKRVPEPPVVWVAKRVVSGQSFACTLVPPQPLSTTFLGHICLTPDHFTTALPLEEARRQWEMFQRPGDLITTMRPGSAQLYASLTKSSSDCLLLNSSKIRAIEGDIPSFDIAGAKAECLATSPDLGRATARLAIAIALVRHLHRLANDPVASTL